MKTRRWGIALALCIGIVASCRAQDTHMTKQEWEQQVQKYTAMDHTLTGQVHQLDNEIATLQTESAGLDADYGRCLSELYGLVGSDTAQANAYRAELGLAEAKASELMRLSDADLATRSGEVKDLDATVKKLSDNRLSLIPEFSDRLTAVKNDLAILEKTLKGNVKIYVVGSWKRDRDCLWNIARKKSIYDDAWLWPKIWQDNRDIIHNPDLISPGEKLKVPPEAPMTSQEKAAAHAYYLKEEEHGGKPISMNKP